MPDSKFPYFLAVAVAAVLLFGSVEALKAFTAYLKAELVTDTEAATPAIVSTDDAPLPAVSD
jgi:hypothetical protein